MPPDIGQTVIERGEPARTMGRKGDPTKRRKISGVDVRTYARKPCAYVEPLGNLPKAGRRDSNNASIRVTAYEGFLEVIVTQVNPSESSQDGSSAVLGEEDKGRKLQTVDLRSAA